MIIGDGIFSLGNEQNTAMPRLEGTGTFRKVGGGTATCSVFTGALQNDWTGTIEVNEGKFLVQPYSGLGTTSLLTVADGAMLEVNANSGDNVGRKISLNGAGLGNLGALRFVMGGKWLSNAALDFASLCVINVENATGEMTIAGALSGAGGFSKIGPGKLILSGSGETGDIYVEAGSLQLVGSITGNVVVQSGATLKATPAQINGTVTVNEGGIWDQTVAAAWDGAGDPNNGGNWNDAANWSGDKVPTESTINKVTGVGNSGNNTRTIVVDAPTEIAYLNLPDYQGGPYQNIINLAADFTVGRAYCGAEGTATVNIPEGFTFTLGNDQTSQLPKLSGKGSFVKAGTGAVNVVVFGGTLDGTWTGTMEIKQGTLNLPGYARLGNFSMLTVDSGAVFVCNPNWPDATGQAITLNGTGIGGQGALRSSGCVIPSDFVLGTDSSINVESGTVTINGSFSGTGSLTKVGLGTLTLSQGIIAGDVTALEGVLALNGSSIIDDGKIVYLESGASLDIADGLNETVGALYFAGVLQGPGTYGRTGSGAAHENDVFFTGPGILTAGSPAPNVTAFSVADQSSGSTLFTN
ncbi:MAG TPA: hypothetical protein VM098_08085, partial [Phycisphaerae bacterium]|nr:hypothetical protein [Phycisphaerae bacterium]